LPLTLHSVKQWLRAGVHSATRAFCDEIRGARREIVS